MILQYNLLCDLGGVGRDFIVLRPFHVSLRIAFCVILISKLTWKFVLFSDFYTYCCCGSSSAITDVLIELLIHSRGLDHLYTIIMNAVRGSSWISCASAEFRRYPFFNSTLQSPDVSCFAWPSDVAVDFVACPRHDVRKNVSTLPDQSAS
jgi:hypothetical protein